MSRLRVLLWRLFARGRAPDELAEEMETHRALLAEEYERGGMSPSEARAQARRQFAGSTQIREQYRTQRRLPLADALVQDVAYTLRQLRASPVFTAAAVVTLALGIGANLAIYRVLDAVAFRDLPVRDPARLVQVELLENGRPMRVSYPFFRELAARQKVLDGMFAVSDYALPTPQGAKGFLASGAYFRTLGVAAHTGRIFTEDDDRPGAPAVAVLSHAFWRREFAGSPAAIGRTLQLNGAVATIVGVMPPDFFGETIGAAPDFWVPMSLQPLVTPGDRLSGASYSWLSVLGRLPTGISARQAEAALDPLFGQIRHLTVTSTGEHYNVRVEPASRGIGDLQSRFERPLWLLMAMVGVVLLLLSSNLANLLLGRAAARTHEIGVRLALGAGRARIARQLLTESLVLAVFGVMLAVPLAARGSTALVALATAGSHLHLTPGWHEAAFTVAIALLATCLFGLAPALAATRVDVQAALQTNRRTTAASGRRYFGNALVVAQISLSLVLISGAVLFARSLWNLRHQASGMDRTALMVDIPLELTAQAVAHQKALVQPLYDRLNSLPGVRSAAVSAFGPQSSLAWTGAVSTPARPTQQGDVTRRVCVTPHYFETTGIPILAGRGITEDDRAGAPRVAVLNQTAARALFGGESPIRRYVSGSRRYDSKEALQVVGVSGDVRFASARAPFDFVLYMPAAQEAAPVTDIVLRASTDRVQIAADVRAAIKSVDPNLKVGAIRTYAEALDAGLGNDRLLAVIASAFGLLALALSFAGVYGVLSYAVQRRTHEIGIRIALGASGADVSRTILRQAAALTAAGVLIGGAGAVAVVTALRSVLFGFVPADYTLPLVAAGLLCAAAAAASYLPARRAARLDPMVALRQE